MLIMIFVFGMLIINPLKTNAAIAPPKNSQVYYISPDKKNVSIKLPQLSKGYGYQVNLYNYNKKKIASTYCIFYATFNKVTCANQIFYYHARVIDLYNSGTAVSGWSKLQAFSTINKANYKMAQAGKTKAIYIKAPKISGVKYYKVYLSTYEDKGYKAVANIKPGKKIKLSKLSKKKKFSYNKYYYSKFVPVLKTGEKAKDFNIRAFKFYKK